MRKNDCSRASKSSSSQHRALCPSLFSGHFAKAHLALQAVSLVAKRHMLLPALPFTKRSDLTSLGISFPACGQGQEGHHPAFLTRLLSGWNQITKANILEAAWQMKGAVILLPRAQTQAHRWKEHLLLIIPVLKRSWQETSEPQTLKDV